MLVGHFGLACLGKSLRKDVPVIWLAVAAYLPDIVRLPLSVFMGHSARDMLSHSLPAVGLLALTIGVAWKLRSGPLMGAVILGLLCLSHWPSDTLTGCKPTLGNGPWKGMFLYRHPLADLPIELGLLALGLVSAKRRAHAWTCRTTWRLLLAGIALQLTFLLLLYFQSEFFVGTRQFDWMPLSGRLPPHEVRPDPFFRCKEPP
jgi:hypothetical protein